MRKNKFHPPVKEAIGFSSMRTVCKPLSKSS